MKICELKINNGSHREMLVNILAVAGYRVSIEGRLAPFSYSKAYSEKDYFIIVETREDVPHD